MECPAQTIAAAHAVRRLGERQRDEGETYIIILKGSLKQQTDKEYGSGRSSAAIVTNGQSTYPITYSTSTLSVRVGVEVEYEEAQFDGGAAADDGAVGGP